MAWSRAAAKPESEEDRYEDFEAFNASLDEEFGDFEVAGSIFPASAILFQLDPIQYDAVRADWEAEQALLIDDGSRRLTDLYPTLALVGAVRSA